MFWKLTALSASSPVESILDKENFTLEELLDEEEIIQECKALNSRLINFLRDRAQVEQLLHYIVEDPPQDADSKRAFKFPFISCEIFTCEIDVILKTLVEDDELMDLLFAFLKPNRTHSALLAGYFSKVVICLMIRKIAALMTYVKEHHYVFSQLVDLIGITSIMEVLVRLVGADDHGYPNFLDVMQWLADSDLLDMIVDKLNPSSPPEAQANAAETLCAITRNAPSALATKLSSPSFVARIFGHALEDSHGLVHSLSVCTSLLDPRKSGASSAMFNSFRGQHMFESTVPVSQETVGAMLPKLSDLLLLLTVASDITVLPTTYGELRPPLGKHRLKIVEFIAVLLKTGNEASQKELVISGTIKRILDLFFEYPYNNALHHQVESIILSCLEKKSDLMVNHILRECNLINKFLSSDKNTDLSCDSQPTFAAAGKKPPRVGYLGHITRISNKISQLSNSNGHIKACLQEHSNWNEWQSSVLQERNTVENVNRWGCGRPTTLEDRTRDSDEEDRDYDVAALANNLSQAFRYKIYGNDDNEEGHNALDRDDDDVYFDDESAEVVISSLRLGDDQGSLFTNSNWFTFQDDRFGSTPSDTVNSNPMEDVDLNGLSNANNSIREDGVLVGDDEDLTKNASKSPQNTLTTTGTNFQMESSVGFFDFNTSENTEEAFAEQPPEWVGWDEPSEMQASGTNLNPFIDNDDDSKNVTKLNIPEVEIKSELVIPNGSTTSKRSLFEEDVEFVGVEVEDGTVKKNIEMTEETSGVKEFNDTNYWKVDQEFRLLD